MHVAKDILLSLVAHKGPADDGKRSEAEWTLYNAGMTGSAAKRSGRCVMLELKERGVPGGEGTAIIPDRRPADR